MSNVYLFFWLMMLGVRQPVTAIAPHGMRGTSRQQAPLQWAPNFGIRKMVSGIEESRIAEVELDGWFVGESENNPNSHMKDRDLIRLFLFALQNAERPLTNHDYSINFTSKIIFHLKDHRTESEVVERDPVFAFILNASTERDGTDRFGPQFDRALLKLGEIRAAELRAFVKQNRTEVVTLQLEGGKTLTRPADLHFVLKDLLKAKPTDYFAYTQGTLEKKLTFTLKNGTKKTFYLCQRRQPAPQEREGVKEKPKPDAFFMSTYWQRMQTDPVEKPVEK